MQPLKYPHDRYDGKVLLTMHDEPYVPRLSRVEYEKTPFLNFKRYWIAWRILMQRYRGNKFSYRLIRQEEENDHAYPLNAQQR